MRSEIETKDYLLNLEEETCVVKATGEKTKASKEVLIEIARSTWREEKQDQAYNSKTLSYNATVSDEYEFIEFFQGPKSLETEIMYSEKEIRCGVRELLSLIPEKFRTVAEMYYLKGMTEMAISKALGVSHQVVHYRKESFLKKARKMAEDHEDSTCGR